MAMRLYKKAEIEAELKTKWKLTPTDESTKTTRIWVTPNGKHITVPVFKNGEDYPDFILDKIVERLNALGENPLKRQ